MQNHIFINSSWVNMMNCIKNVWMTLLSLLRYKNGSDPSQTLSMNSLYEWTNEMGVCIIPIFYAKLSISYLKQHFLPETRSDTADLSRLVPDICRNRNWKRRITQAYNILPTRIPRFIFSSYVLYSWPKWR